MKFYFISPFCLLRPTTNRIFDVRFCDLLAGTGAIVTMVHPYYFMKENVDEKNIEESYGIVHRLKFRMLNTSLREDSPHAWQVLVLLTSFFFYAIKIIFSERKNPGDVYVITRDNKSALPMMLLKKMLGRFCRFKIITTIHEVKKGKLNAWMYHNYDGLFVTTTSAKKKLLDDLAVSIYRIQRLVSPVSRINYSLTKEEARKKINYDDSKPLVVYSGKLGKGISELNYIVDAAELLPEYNFILTGGKKEAVNHYLELCENRKIKNVFLPGFINDAAFISNYQVAADVLISYYSKHDHIVEYNFPQKLVEYMFTRNPIVTPDFPATHDIINASNAIIVEPDRAASLAEGIKKAIENRTSSQALAEKAFQDIQPFSFENQGEHLIGFFRKL